MADLKVGVAVSLKLQESYEQAVALRDAWCAFAASLRGATGAGRAEPLVYIAGPMTGLPSFNYPAFHAAAAAWRAAGWAVENPAENFGGDKNRTYREYITAALRQLVTCDAIALLPGWTQSKGAVLERHVAEVMGLRILSANALEPAAPAIEPSASNTGV